MFKRIFSTSFHSLTARAFSTGTNLFVIFFISRFLEQDQLGLYGIAFFFFQLFAVVTYQGLDVFFGKEVACAREDEGNIAHLFDEFRLSALYGTLVSILVALIFHLFYHKIGPLLLLLSLVNGVLYALERNLSGFLLGKEKVAVDAFYAFLSFVVMVAWLLGARGEMTLEHIFLARIAAFAVGVVGRGLAVVPKIRPFPPSWRLRHFKETRFYGFLVLCVFAERHADVFILSFFIEDSLLGGYFLSLSIYRTVALVIEVVAQGLTPFISRVYRGKERPAFGRFVNLLFFTSLALGLLLGGMLYVSRDFLVSIFNENLAASCGPFLALLSLVVPLKVVIFILGSVMSSSRFQKVRFYINLYATLAMVSALPLLVSRYSAMGAIYARIGFEIAVFIASVYFVFAALPRAERRTAQPPSTTPRPLRIGFDGKWFFSGNPSGKVVVRNLLKFLSTTGDYELYVFLKKEERDKKFPFPGPGVHRVYVWGKVNLLSNLLAVPLKARKLQLDICIFQYYSPLFTRFKRLTFINDAIFKTNPEYFTLKERIYFSPMRFLAAQSHRVCTISRSEKNRLVRCGFAAQDKIDVVHLGVDPRYRPREAHDPVLLSVVRKAFDLPEKFLLYLGRLSERKNLDTLITSLALLEDRSIKLVLAGAYDSKIPRLHQLVSELGLTDRVIYTGFIDDAHIAPLYALAELFCYVSHDEGFGLPPLEAMASGVPVVVSSAGSLPEICGPAGNYVEHRYPEHVASIIGRLLRDRELYAQKRALGLERAQNFTWEKAAKRLLESCHKTLHAGAVSRRQS